jgi:regulator of protease activity HflC (stomatin/prohibitin superfamily)
MIAEIETKSTSGFLALGLLLPGAALFLAGTIIAGQSAPPLLGLTIPLLVVDLFLLSGLFTVAPKQPRVLQLFGKYVGTVHEPGLKWANPFYSKRKISTRVRNFESSKLKVNDHDGSPIEIAAIVVWKVVDTAEAIFEVDNFENYVQMQTESAVRNLATQHPYDAAEGGGQLSLRGNTTEIADLLKKEIQERLAKAGVEVMEARISHMAYAPEIASAMLRRQQAGAVIAARTRIVEGAVTMVEMALDHISKSQMVELDNDRKAAMVSNLLVVLCGDREPQPVVNAGTIYQ